MRRGQVFTLDMVFSAALFIGILIMIAYLWDSTVSEIQDAETVYDINWHTTRISETLVRTPGFPDSWVGNIKGAPGAWDYSNVVVFGLADSQTLFLSKNIQDRIINPDKFLWFTRLLSEYYSTALAMILRTGKYDLYVQSKCKYGGVECFRNLYAPTLGSNDVIFCNNSFNFTVTQGITDVQDDGSGQCIVGKYASPAEVDFITSSAKNAVFNEPVIISDISWTNQRQLDKAIEIKVVVYQKQK